MRIQLFTQDVTSLTAESSSKYSFTYNPNHMHCFGYCDSCESEFYGSFGKKRKVDRENFLKFYNFTKCPVCGAPFKREKGYFAMGGSEILEWIRLSTWPIIEKEQAYKFDPVKLQQSTYLTRQELELRTGVCEGKITLDELHTVLPGIEEDEIPCYVNEYLVNINGIFKLLRWRRPSTLHLAQKKASSFLESCSAQAVGEVAKNINIEKTPAFLQEYFLHLINLDTEIHSASQYLSHLYVQQHNISRRIRDEKFQFQYELEQQLDQLVKQSRATEKELKTLLACPSTVNVSEIEASKPSKPAGLLRRPIPPARCLVSGSR